MFWLLHEFERFVNQPSLFMNQLVNSSLSSQFMNEPTQTIRESYIIHD